MDDCIDSLRDAMVFSTLDASSSYCPIRVEESDRDMSSYISHHGLYRFTKVPFGLGNTSGTFERTMDVIRSFIKWQNVILYLDEFVVVSKTSARHIEHGPSVLTLFQDAGATLKLKKCEFF